ncbi:transglycosylase domain-containing protein [Ktedonobacteria bacterium brp13]|nr:transglycosylase domain-containing protein [Ktedonobacteria bacterium brp13]
MSDTWNQHPANKQRPDQATPPKTGGLLSGYKNQQSQADAPINQPFNQNIQNNQSRPGTFSNQPGSASPPSQAGRVHSSLLKNYGPASNAGIPQGPQSYPPSQRPQGPQGYPPPQGPQGYQPPRGSQGYPPSQGPQGYPPSQGPQGYQPPRGGQGPQGYPSQQGQQGYPPQQRVQGPQAGHPFAQPWSNAMDTMRTWSGKMAAAVGYQPQRQPQPPAPQMVRYRSPVPPNPPYMGGPGGPGGPGGGGPGGPGGPGGGGPGGPYNGNSGGDRWRRSLALRLSHQKRQRRKTKGFGRVTTSIIISLVALVLIVGFAGGAYGYNYYTQQLPLMQHYANKQISQNTRIYDRNGVLLYEAYNQSTQPQQGRRVAVQFQDIPKVMQDAMISIEDKTFWTNAGVDPLAIVRAGTSSGGGASTLTQQLIKNLSGNDQGTYQRKIAEAAMAIGLTQNYSKSKIMEMYFNVAPFGANTYGVEVAAEDLFGLQPVCNVGKPCVPGITHLEYNSTTKKNDPILGLARATLLAAIPNNPSIYDPTLGSTAQANLLVRQKLVLQDMITQGRSVDGQPITTAMAQQAEADAAKMTFHPYQGIKRAPGFVDYVVQQVEAALGNGDPQAGVYAFLTGGYNIRTTIDVNLDEYTQAEIYRHLYQPELQKARGYYATLNVDNNVNNGAAVVMDAKNGEILAMVGSAQYNSTNPKVDGQFNAAVGARPVGSSFKPFDYATAFEMGWNPGIVLQDTRTYFPNGAAAGTPVATQTTPADDMTNQNNGIYSPSDYGYRYWEAPFTVRFATANSFNISAIRAMQFTGQQAVLDTTRRLGITGLKASGLATAIGAQDISPLQMAAAYDAFANNGSRVPPQTILDIWDNYGNSLYHYNENNPPTIKVFSPQVAYLMTSVLIDEPSRSFEFSGDHDLSFTDIDPSCAYNAACGHQVAAKTGTTDSYADNWTVGYTPNVVEAVWVGNSDDSAMNNVIGITGAAPIWHSVMERTLGYCDHTLGISDPTDFYDDGVPCGPEPNYNFSFSKNPQWTFPVPSGLVQSTPAGLPLTTNVQTDWMLQQ